MESEAGRSIFKLQWAHTTDSTKRRKSIVLIDHNDSSFTIYRGHLPLPDNVMTSKTHLRTLERLTLGPESPLSLCCQYRVISTDRTLRQSVWMTFKTAGDRDTMVRTVKQLLDRTHRFDAGSLYVRSNMSSQDDIVNGCCPFNLEAIGFGDSEESKDEVDGTVPVFPPVGGGASTSAKESANHESLPPSDAETFQEELRVVKEQVQVQQSHVASLVVALITGSKPPPPGTDTDPWDYLTAFDLGPEEMAALKTHDDFKNVAEARYKHSFASSQRTIESSNGLEMIGGKTAIDRAESPEETPAAVAAVKELGWMACAPAVQELIKQMPNAGWAEMRQVREVLLQEPEAGQDFLVLRQFLQCIPLA